MTGETRDPFASLRQVREGCASDLALDRLRLNEPGSEATRSHVESCTLCRERLLALESNDAQFQQSVFIQGLAARTKRRARFSLVTVISGATAALAAVFALFVALGPEHTQTDDGVRAKGGETLTLVVKRQSGTTEEVGPTSLLNAGDVLGFHLQLLSPSHVVILGLDTRGKVSVYTAQEQSVFLPAGKHDGLGAIALDDAPGTERIFALLCDTTPDVARVVTKAQGRLHSARSDPSLVGSLDVGCRELHALFKKRTPP